jgi:hypothetical protein
MYAVEPALPKAVQAMAIHPCGQNHNERIAFCVCVLTDSQVEKHNGLELIQQRVIYDQAAQPSTNRMKFQKKKLKEKNYQGKNNLKRRKKWNSWEKSNAEQMMHTKAYRHKKKIRRQSTRNDMLGDNREDSSSPRTKRG